MAHVSGSQGSVADRAAATRELVAAADACTDAADRAALLREVAALNTDLALALTSALCVRYRWVAADDPALQAQAHEAYLRAVATLPRGADLVSEILPALRAAVLEYGRRLDGPP